MRKACVIFIALVLIMSGCSSSNHENEAKPPKSQSELKGKDYKDVVVLFEEAGFLNIETEKIEDLITGWLIKDGEVESVSIGGDTDFSTSKWYSKDARIRISYHTFPNKDDSNSSADSSSDYSNVNTIEIDGFVIDIPSEWEKDDQFYYPETGSGMTMFYPSIIDESVTSFDELVSIRDVIIAGLKQSFENVKNESIEKTTINGNDSIKYEFDTTIESTDIHMETDLLLSPNNKIIVLVFGQSSNSSKNYFSDYHEALKTLRVKGDDKPVVNTDVATDDAAKTNPEKKIDVYTKDNCEDLANLLTAEYLDGNVQKSFARKYEGQIIEFDAVVGTIFPDENFKTIASYVFAPDNGDTIGAALFMVESASFPVFKWDRDTKPEYLYPGSKVRIQAKVLLGSDPLYIFIRPTKTWGR